MSNRRELILNYKQSTRPMGVYQIKNQKTGKIFIGGSLNLPGSFNSHRFQLNYRVHRNIKLQEDWHLFGQDAFTFDILETINPEEIAKEQWRDAVSKLEEEWLAKLSLIIIRATTSKR
ncbi:hypothetical protein N752_08275 [Desulforamulus aquiferis]|nr:GIY-YIG nuclease family protein [Desulforamulus aquiferis]RYD05881.1 hypothetical protein N752_08275 [Desulforamulus aquiferis]